MTTYHIQDFQTPQQYGDGVFDGCHMGLRVIQRVIKLWVHKIIGIWPQNISWIAMYARHRCCLTSIKILIVSGFRPTWHNNIVLLPPEKICSMATADPANKISESSKNQSNIHTTYQVDSITVCNIPPTTKLNHTQSHLLLVSLTTRIRGLYDVFGNKLLVTCHSYSWCFC